MEPTVNPSLPVNPPVTMGAGTVRKLYNPNVKPILTDMKSGQENRGRPVALTDEVVSKLIVAFQRGLSDTKACEYAKISRETYYKHLKSNSEFSDKIIEAKNVLLMTSANNIATFLTSKDKEHDNIKAKLSLDMVKMKDPEGFSTPKVDPGIGQQTNTQNNYLFISHDQLREYIKTKNITAAEALAIAEGTPDQLVAGGGTEEDTVDVHQDPVRGGSPALQGMPTS